MRLTKRLGGALLGSAAAVAVVAFHTPAVGQAPGAVNVSTSVAECKACHSGADQIGVRDFVEKFRSHEFIRLDESRIWDEKDPHSKAYSVLVNSPVTKAMSEKLKYDVLTDARCLSCHATDTHRERNRFDTSNGVGCAGCHGLQSDWQTEHYRSPNGVMEWRTKSAEEKHAKGLVNLRDPAVKAAACASCHVGDSAVGRVITHEMYAAGHPPLPPFELLAFSTDQPRHWNNPSDLKYFKDADDATWKRFSAMKNDDLSARHVLIGAIAALKAEAKLLQAEAAESLRKQGGLGAVPLDYARFDCYACHHELTGANSDRQKRGYPGAPGRPPLKAWNGALAMATAKVIGDDAAYAKVWDDAQAAAYDQPYANATKMAAAAKALEAWCDGTAAKLAAPVTKAHADHLKETLRTMLNDDKTLADPEAAMTLIWALKALDGGDGANWSDLRKVLPLGPQDGVDPLRSKPVEAGLLIGPRLERFNAFTIAGFRKVKLPPAR